MRIKRSVSITIVLLFLVLLGARLALPYWVKSYVNRTLNRIPDYRGSIKDLDIHLIRGAYTIQGFRLDKVSSKIPVPFFRAEEADFSIEWRALFEGKVVGEITLDRPQINFVAGQKKEDSQLKIDTEWLSAVKDLFPLRLNHFDITRGEIHYRDYQSVPKVDVKLSDVEMKGQNFNNTRAPSTTPATIDARAVAQGRAPLTLKASLHPSAKEPTFELETALTDLPVPSLNDFLQAYAAVDAEKGTISIYSEMKAKQGRIEGYVKPLIKDLSVASWKSDKGNPLGYVWQNIVGIFAELLTNHRRDQIATTVPFSGPIGKPDTGAWSAIWSLMGNAFIQALKPGFENGDPTLSK